MGIKSELCEAVPADVEETLSVRSDKKLLNAIGLARISIKELRKANTIIYKNLAGAIMASAKEISLDWLFNTRAYRQINSNGVIS